MQITPLQECSMVITLSTQCTKPMRSDSSGPVDVGARLLDFILYLPDGQPKVLGEFVLRNFRQAGKLNWYPATGLNSACGGPKSKWQLATDWLKFHSVTSPQTPLHFK